MRNSRKCIFLLAVRIAYFTSRSKLKIVSKRSYATQLNLPVYKLYTSPKFSLLLVLADLVFAVLVLTVAKFIFLSLDVVINFSLYFMLIVVDFSCAMHACTRSDRFLSCRVVNSKLHSIQNNIIWVCLALCVFYFSLFYTFFFVEFFHYLRGFVACCFCTRCVYDSEKYYCVRDNANNVCVKCSGRCSVYIKYTHFDRTVAVAASVRP